MLVSIFQRTVRDRRLVAPGDRVLVAVSGGPDSCALLDVLARLAAPMRLALAAASVDHGLRPDAARDVEIARAQAARVGVPFHPIAIRVAKGGSVQARARSARYEALRDLAGALGAVSIAVGHTRDDQAETVLARVLRGAGVRGLAGIAPRRADGVVRPLIDASRAEVHAWAERLGVQIARDPSNDDPRFLRSRVRHVVLPTLAVEDARVVAHLAALADDARAVSSDLARRARRMIGQGGSLDASRASRASAALRAEVLSRWAEREIGRPPSRAQVEALERALGGKGEALLAGGRVARLRDGWLVIEEGGKGAPPRSRGEEP